MDAQDIEAGLKAFVADLEVGGERVPVDRVIRAHLALFEDLRSLGLTWPAIASMVLRAGGRRKDGGPLSADQIRADVGRLLRRRDQARGLVGEASTVEVPRQELSPAITRKRAAPNKAAVEGGTKARDTRQFERQTSISSKAVSNSEIAEVLKRVRNS